MTKTEYVDWKNNPVTIEVFNELRERIEGLKAELAGSAGIDSRQDGVKVGAIQAYVDILEISYDEVQND